MHVKVVCDLLFNIWAKVATISGTLSTVKMVNNGTAILRRGCNPCPRLVGDVQTRFSLNFQAGLRVSRWPQISTAYRTLTPLLEAQVS